MRYLNEVVLAGQIGAMSSELVTTNGVQVPTRLRKFCASVRVASLDRSMSRT